MMESCKKLALLHEDEAVEDNASLTCIDSLLGA